MTDYLVRFAVLQSETVEEDLLEDGRFSVSTRAGKCTVEAEGAGSSAVAAAKDLAIGLMAKGVHVEEALPDIVTMADIARRANVSKQAVSKWANQGVGDEHFPRPWNSTDTTLLWDWCHVNEWLRSRGKEHDDWSSLTVHQAIQVNEWLDRQRIPRRPADVHLRPVPLGKAELPMKGELHVQRP